MRFNFLQAKEAFKSYANNGTCDLDEVGVVINQVCERLYETGKFWGMVQRIAICHTSNCVTLPYNVDSILEISGQCGQPISLRSQWFEFLPGGPWQLSQCNKWCDQAVPRNTACTAFDICGTKLLRVYADLPENDEQILLQGYDGDGQRVRTLVSGNWVDGEYIALNNATPQLSTIQWSHVETVQKPLTNGKVQIYTVDPNNTGPNEGLLAEYQPNETNPSYQRFHISGFCANADHPKRITMLVKMKFVPLVRDTDMLPITSFNAMMFMMMSQYFWENEAYDKAQVMELKAIACLNEELKQKLGGQQNIPKVRFAGFGNRPVSWQMR